jgi:hypothetical protein
MLIKQTDREGQRRTEKDREGQRRTEKDRTLKNAIIGG